MLPCSVGFRAGPEGVAGYTGNAGWRIESLVAVAHIEGAACVRKRKASILNLNGAHRRSWGTSPPRSEAHSRKPQYSQVSCFEARGWAALSEAAYGCPNELRIVSKKVGQCCCKAANL